MDSIDVVQFVVENGSDIIAILIGVLTGTIVRGLMQEGWRKKDQIFKLEALLISHKGRLVEFMAKHDIFVSYDRIEVINETWLKKEYRHLWPMITAYVLDEVVGNGYYKDQPTAYDALVLLLESNGGHQLDFAHKMEPYSDRAARGMRVAFLRRNRDKDNAHWDQAIEIELSIGMVSTSVVEPEQASLPIQNQ